MKLFSEQTPSRWYFVNEDADMFYASFQPINPRTGSPWQASRGITQGRNVWRGADYRSGLSSGLIQGEPPAFEVWSKKWSSIRRGYATQDDAVAAIRAEQKRSGK